MKKTLNRWGSLLCMLLVFNAKAGAQLASSIPHTFSVATTPGAFPAGAVNLIIPAALQDEWDTLIAPPSFSFNFAGSTYTKVVLSTNGWIALCPTGVGPAVPASIPNAMPNNALANNTTGYPVIAPLWDDHAANLISYVMSGGALWVRWAIKWQKTHAAAGATLIMTKLDPANNSITFYYANNSTYIPANPSASIGIAGVCPGDFYSVSVTSATAAFVDSAAENTNIGQGTAGNFRPYNCYYTFTPLTTHANDACASARLMGTVTSTCTAVLASTYNAVTSGAPGNCSTSDVKDVWLSYIKPSGVASVKFVTSPGACGTVSGTSLEVYSACGGTVLGCGTTSVTYPGFAELSVNRSACIVETLYVRVTSDGDIPGKFEICAQDISTSTGVDCASASPICFPLPYNTSGTTLGSGNNYNDSSLCQSTWMTGEDFVYSFSPTTTGCFNFIVSGTGPNSYPGLHIFDGCPDDHINSTCIASSQNSADGDSILNLTLSGGHTYYVLIDNASAQAGVNSINYNLSVTTSATSAPPNDPCPGAASLGTVAFNQSCVWSASYSTQCSNPSPLGGYPNPSCGGFSPALTNDIWFTFQPNFSGTLLINTQGTGSNPAQHLGMAVYTGSCGLLNLVACAGDSTGIAYMPSMSLAVTNQTYYLRVWSNGFGDPGLFQLCFSSNCSPPNDLPVNAVPLPIGVPMQGDNTCSTGAQEMVNPINCPTGVVNTVWYKIAIPPSGQVAVRISQISNYNAAVAAFNFPNGPAQAATSWTRIRCNDDIIFAPPCPICGMTGDNDAAINFTGTPGDTVYIAVDGEFGFVGSFWITFIEGTLTSVFPPIYRKDCGNPEFICSNANYSIPNGGIGSNGNNCDFLAYPCTGGASTSEVGSTWMQFTVAAGSPLGFTITPTDSTSPVANYNFYLWDITGISNICSQLTSTSPVRCNTIAGTGKTGMRAPAAGTFSNTIAGQPTARTYMLMVENLTSANGDDGTPGTFNGFVLDWAIYSGGVPIGATQLSGTSPTATWTGTVVDTNYQFLPNWKGVGTCPATLPNCTTDVFVSAASKQCWVMGNSYAKNITINAGGTLRLLPGANLHVCGNYVNNGTLIAQAGSTITFEGPSKQTISGSLTGINGFANLVINKTAGTDSVKLMNDIDVNGNFLTSNATSIFNVNGKYMKVGGNYSNNNGNFTFTGNAGSTIEFNGLTNQYFTNVNGTLNLNRVMMNKNLGKLYLTGANSNMNVDSVLNLTLGNIVTPTTLEVNVKLGNISAIINHSVNSYVDGRLRRKLFLGSIDWPVGDSLVPNQGVSKGYELANITFTSSTVIQDIVGWFDAWPTPPPPNGPVNPDFCAVVPAANSYTTWYDQQIFDNGYWAFSRSVANFNGGYNVTLYNTGGTNTTGGVAWTVGYAPLASNPSLQASWGLIGTCVTTSTGAITRRNAFNVPAMATTSFNHYYATVQAITTLPVELVYFNAELKGEEVLCSWETASETNNEYFDVERSLDGNEFISIGTVPGFGAGTTTEKRNYSLIDKDHCEEIRYYRLKQVDIDGNFSFSDIVALNCVVSKDELKVYPNPGNTSVFSSFYETRGGIITIEWLDLLGKVVREENHSVVKGFNTVKSDISSLSKGVYYMRIKDELAGSRQIKFLKN